MQKTEKEIKRFILLFIFMFPKASTSLRAYRITFRFFSAVPRFFSFFLIFRHERAQANHKERI